MELNIIPVEGTPPVARTHVISVTIRTFKGRRNVQAHLFRLADETEAAEELAALRGVPGLVGAPLDPNAPGADDLTGPEAETDALRTVLEAFTEAERDAVVDYLSRRYADRLTCIIACPLQLPVPRGVVPFSALPEGKTMGVIRFDDVPRYPLHFAMRGFYDLAQHEPLVHEQE
ncbi:hypothetical protein RVX_R15150 [Nitratidesulfovibrio sp. HK-II]|uniref:hypothetical protein n=1 Tax=Nitratidesulfovibrio sp. HK-II TaxID=2009266 RepID=UPI000E2F96EA|nr:hypothetical protein [Nitratidesulfovibrio sp. HK-II]GBO95839.1 hypothetical protein RVX_0879 [Nitratidesulfovibrio sp. HK-II]